MSTGDPPKGAKGAVSPLAFENMQIYQKIRKRFSKCDPPKSETRIADVRNTPFSFSPSSHLLSFKSQSRPTTACDASDIRWQGFLGRFVKPCCYRNKKGGRWLINLDKKQRGSCLDNFWLEVVSFCRGYFLAQSGYLSNY